MGTLYQTDPVLRVIDPESMPQAFLDLPDREQRWRGRLFMAVFWMSHHSGYSWSAALTNAPEAADWRRIIEETPDALLLARFRAAAAEIAVEVGDVAGPVQ